jgi:hypothetical protein
MLPKSYGRNRNFYVGQRRTVLVERDVLKFKDLQGRTHSMRILSSKDAPLHSQRNGHEQQCLGPMQVQLINALLPHAPGHDPLCKTVMYLAPRLLPQL